MSTKLELTETALTVLRERYLWRDSGGTIQESPEGLFERVAAAIGEVEGRQKKRWAEEFHRIMVSRRFLPNTPTLMNAGKSEGQLSACFVIPVEDSLEGIFGALKDAARIHQSGGGTGFSFSRLRARGSAVRSTFGTASGPVAFIRVFDTATEAIKQGGVRRGANMGILRVDHPDIFDFVEAKRDQGSLANFNLSVAVTDEFMWSVIHRKDFALREPGSGREVRRIRAQELFDRIAEAAWESGDPGLIFLDRINFFNPTPEAGEMESTNPCGEQPLLPYESCNLGSLNLGEYVSGTRFDWEGLRKDVHVGVRFLDDVIEANHYVVEECGRITRRNRKIGLGVMGFADALFKLGVPYFSEEAFRWGERWMSFVDREGKLASMLLAEARGAFPAWKRSLWQRLGFKPMRNATVSTVAPTGTVSIIAGASSGIEPVYSARMVRNVLAGKRLVEIHPAIQQVLEQEKFEDREIEKLGEEDFERILGVRWQAAHRVPARAHVRMQAAFQRHSDSAVSKTVNLPEAATVGDVVEAYCYAFLSGCKGITVYRDKSRKAQVLERGERISACDICID